MKYQVEKYGEAEVFKDMNPEERWRSKEKLKGSKLKYLQQLKELSESNDIDPKYSLMDRIELSKDDEEEKKLGPIIEYEEELEETEYISPIKPKIVIEEEEEEEIKDAANVIGFELKGLKKGYDFVSPTKQYQNEIKSINTPSRQGYNYLTPVKKPVEQKIVAKVKVDELTLMKQMDKPKPRSMWERMKEVFDLV
jgi:hypothetical protein